MRFFATAVALLSVVASTLSLTPPEGTYVIVNRVLSPDGDELAITFNGQARAATLTPNKHSDVQRWMLKDYDLTKMSVTPVTATDLQAAWGDGYVTVLPANNYIWTIQSTDSGYIIQDGDQTVFWGAANATANQNVTIGAGTGNEKQRWILFQTG